MQQTNMAGLTSDATLMAAGTTCDEAPSNAGATPKLTRNGGENNSVDTSSSVPSTSASVARQWFTGLSVTELNNAIAGESSSNNNKLLWKVMVHTTATAAPTAIDSGTNATASSSTRSPDHLLVHTNGRRTNGTLQIWWRITIGW